MKRAAIIGMLWLLALWPIAQRALVVRYSVDPWELFGWGMYTTPHLDGDVRAFGMPGDRALLLDADEREAVAAFTARWRELGRLASPDAAAALLLSRRPELESVLFRATQLELDPKTDRIRAREDRFTFPE